MDFCRSWLSWFKSSESNPFSDLLDQNNTTQQAIRAAASDEPDADGNVLFGQMQGSIVGLKYYSGVVNPGEMVSLVREPNNIFDRNAIMVANIYGSQVGHIKRELAEAMAYIMDNKLAKVEGVVHYGTKKKFFMPVILSFWGKHENNSAVIQRLARYGYKLNTGGVNDTHFSGEIYVCVRCQLLSCVSGVNPKLYGLGSGMALNNRGVTVILTPEELKNAFDNLFEGLLESKDGEKEAAESVATRLLPHQRQALSWMCARENQCVLPPFWEKRGDLYYNTLTCFSAKELPERVLGGILADDMGLGKTLTTIALILTNFREGKPLPVCNRPEHSSPRKVDRAGLCGEAARGLRSSLTYMEESSRNRKDTTKPSERGKRRTTAPKRKFDMPPSFDDADFASLYSFKKKKKAASSSTLAVNYCNTGSSGEAASARPTLIICPLSVLSNWLDQFEEHVRADIELKVYMYHGPDRIRSIHFLSSQDVVLTTYNVLAAEFSGNNRIFMQDVRSPLHEINWLRVVLDEGHVVRNPNALMTKAVLELRAERRWILSAVLCRVFVDLIDRPLQSGLFHRGGGTPIQNNVKDLWMLLAFLRLKPFDVKEWWNRVIQRPVMQGDRVGLKNFQTLVKCITLRRTKSSEVDGRPLVSLPVKTVCVEQVELSAAEREEYQQALDEGRNIIGSRYVAEGVVLRYYADVLAILMRLRQHCCHPDLLTKTTSDAGSASTPAELRKRLIEKLRVVLASGSDEECSVCLDSVRVPVITHCAHVFCRSCIAQVIGNEQESARCPLCRSVIKINELVEFPPEEMAEENGGRSPGKGRTSSKIQALIGNLQRLQREDSSVKCLVVSQFTRFLTILETPLREHGFRFVRLDGAMSQRKRTQVIQEFQSGTPSSPAIMLLSLKAGEVGVNLTAASHVFLMDPAWNPATEEQCIARCHRLGQKRNVFVTKFIVKNSVEEKMVKIQKQKQNLAEAALGSADADHKTSRIIDIMAIMEL
ncbi:helicase-like transcription factor isoform X3 [Festucalex cinctus]